MNENHPVLIALEEELAALLEQYRRRPDELNRYRVVKLERLIGEWAPTRLPVA